MEWVETTGKSIEEATAIALEQLGVNAEEAEVEILEEPKSGLFGRVRAEARVRARVRPTTPRAKPEQRKPRSASASKDSRPARSSSSEVSSSAPRAPRPRSPRLDEPALTEVPADIDEAGRTFLEGLLESIGLEGTIETGIEGHSIIEFRIVGRDLGVLIGPRAQTMQAIQELLRTVVHYETNTSSGRIVLDVAGYREKRRAALGAFATKVAGEVVKGGSRRALEPMNASDRKVVHDAVALVEGVSSTSEGEDPYRFVVILPA